jgi:hypothetical protein
MAAITAAVIGTVTAATTIGMSAANANKAKKAAEQAKQDAAKALDNANKMLEKNFYKGLSIQKEPYELQREALAQSGAQAMEAAREQGRATAATAGTVQMAQNQAQANIRSAMGQELTGLERLTAEEESRLRDAKAQIQLDQAAGASLAAAEAKKEQGRYTTEAMQAATNLGQQIYENAPLFPKTKIEKTGNPMPQTFNVSPGANNANIAAAQAVVQGPQTLQPQLPSSLGNQNNFAWGYDPSLLNSVTGRR